MLDEKFWQKLEQWIERWAGRWLFIILGVLLVVFWGYNLFRMAAVIWESRKLPVVAGILVFAFLFYRFHQGLRDMLPSAVARAVVEGAPFCGFWRQSCWMRVDPLCIRRRERDERENKIPA